MHQMSFNSKNAQKLKETNIPNIHLRQKSFKSFILNGISQPVVQAYSSKRNVPEAVRVRNLGRQGRFVAFHCLIQNTMISFSLSSIVVIYRIYSIYALMIQSCPWTTLCWWSPKLEAIHEALDLEMGQLHTEVCKKHCPHMLGDVVDSYGEGGGAPGSVVRDVVMLLFAVDFKHGNRLDVFPAVTHRNMYPIRICMRHSSPIPSVGGDVLKHPARFFSAPLLPCRRMQVWWILCDYSELTRHHKSHWG